MIGVYLMSEKKKLGLYILVFAAAYLIPFQSAAVSGAILESFYMLQDYAREHVLHCLIPALFIAGAIANFVSQNAVLKYFGSKAKKWLSYSVASVSGSVLAVCSCTVLPLFSGIYIRGAGIGPAIAFLYSGPSINILAVILTARVLGWEYGVARAIGAIVFAILIGLIMSVIFGKEDAEREELGFPETTEAQKRTLGQDLIYFLNLVLILIFAAWVKPAESSGFWYMIYQVKWPLTIAALGVLAIILYRWFDRDELKNWVDSTWDFSKQILPLLFAGVLVAGFLMGSPGSDGGIIPSEWVESLVGGNSFRANFLSSMVGALMYFATLTEIPIIQGLMASGMGKGPILALLLAGPALSLPNMLVIRSVLGNLKTFVYIVLVIVMATISGLLFGYFF